MSTAQLIDAEGEFAGSLPVADGDCQVRNYKIVSVVGCQSGGKSTLLNHTFGTSFPVLDAPRKGRRRTTLGVWGALARTDGDTYVVLDVEGTDSRERGEGAKAFESRTTLFTLALSDCVLVNMWAHDIGRYSAANYDLFETVFAHAIALRRAGSIVSDRPVPVLIVVRDHDGEAPVADIRRVLMGDLLNIWEGLRVRDLALEDIFRIDVLALPHKTYAAGAFTDGVRLLARRVSTDATTHNGNNQLVPLEAFDDLAERVWSAVCRCTGERSDEENGGSGKQFSLDLPKQAALTAYYRCGEIANEIWNGSTGSEADCLRADIESHWQEPLSGYGSRINTMVREAFAAFDNATAPYAGNSHVTDVVTQRRTEFATQLAARVVELRERYLSVCKDSCMNEFDDKFRPMLGGTNGFERNARRLAKTCVNRYRELMVEGDLPHVLLQFIEVRTDDASESAGYVRSDDDNVAEVVDVTDLQLGLDDELEGPDADEWSVERFKRDITQKIEERKRLGELMLPGGGNFGPGGPKRDPWWKGLLIRSVILLINYLQATHGQRAALRFHRQHEKEFPPAPSF